MRYRLVGRLIVAWSALLSASASAAVSDWYGTWRSTYTGDSSGVCTVTISAGNASQASATMNCANTAGDPPFAGSGFITAAGSVSLAGSSSGSSGGFPTQVAFGGAMQGDSGQGQWTSSTVTPAGTFPRSGTWTTVRTSAPQPVATDPNRTVAPPVTVQSSYTAATGRLPDTAVTAVATGTLGRASLKVTLDLSRIPLGSFSAATGAIAAGYNVYVAALVPAGVLGLSAQTWFMLRPTVGWGLLGSPIAAYMQGVAQGASTSVLQVSILEDIDVTALLGAEIYIGYGLDSDEMLAQGRYRGVYIVR